MEALSVYKSMGAGYQAMQEYLSAETAMASVISFFEEYLRLLLVLMLVRYTKSQPVITGIARKTRYVRRWWR